MRELPELIKLREKTEFIIALVGNPNVGKSTLFNRLTGMGVLTANYPGMTVSFNLGETTLGDHRIGIIDLPGTYALGAVSQDQQVARKGILEVSPDVVIVILDATNLSRNLYLLLQILDLEAPVIAALNLVDEAERGGLFTDVDQLSEILGIPVVPTVATRGDGIDELINTALEEVSGGRPHVTLPFYYANDIEEQVRVITRKITRVPLELPFSITPRALALLLLEQDQEFLGLLGEREEARDLLKLVDASREKILQTHGNDAAVVIARERYGIAGSIVSAVQQVRERVKPSWGERLWEYTTATRTGVPLLLGVLALLLFTLFFAGNYLSSLLSRLWNTLAAGHLERAITYAFGNNVFSTGLIWGVVYGIEAILSVAIPYVFIFYIILALLEDSGYLNSVAFLTDRTMHRVGLHGRAIIPLISAAGCNVPAIMGTRVLSTKRERIISGVLIVLVPCSARTAVIIGGVARFSGWGWALLLYLVIFLLIAVVGLVMNKVMPGESSGLVMEVFPFRRPSWLTMLKKTWMRLRDFVFVATPIMLVGSFLLGMLYASGWLPYLEKPLKPITEFWLGLPAVAGLALIFAFLRKELALQLLLVFAAASLSHGVAVESLNQLLTSQQIFIFALVNAIYIPCASTFAVLVMELGWKKSVQISLITILLALLVGGLAHLILAIF